MKRIALSIKRLLALVTVGVVGFVVGVLALYILWVRSGPPLELWHTEKLNAEFRQAMKDKDTLRRSVLRMVLASVKNAEIAKRAELTDSDILGLISKEAKQHEDSIQAYKEGNRPGVLFHHLGTALNIDF